MVLYDLDGTLANSVDLIVTSYNHAFATVLGRQVPREKVLGWIGRSLPEVFGEVDPEHAVELERRYMEYNLTHLNTITGYPGIPEVINDLAGAGLRQAVVTSKRRSVAERTLVFAGIPDAAELVVALEDSERHKPDPEPLLVALERVDAHPRDAVYVGDAVTDLLAAQAAQLAGIGVTWGAGSTSELQAAPHEGLAQDAATLRNLLLG